MLFLLSLAIALIILKPVIALFSFNLARNIDGQSSVPIPTFGNWGTSNGNMGANKTTGGYPQEPSTSNSGGYGGIGGYQQA